MIKAYHNVLSLCNPNANMPDIDTLAGECQQNYPYSLVGLILIFNLL